MSETTDRHRTEPATGTPAGEQGAEMVCSKCGEPFQPRAWQIASQDRRCLPCKRAQQNARNAANPDSLRLRAKARYAANRDYEKEASRAAA